MKRTFVSDLLRAVAGLASVWLLFSVLFSFIFMAAVADHCCDGQGCVTCETVRMCKRSLSEMDTGKEAPAQVTLPVQTRERVGALSGFDIVQDTLVRWKVRLDD